MKNFLKNKFPQVYKIYLKTKLKLIGDKNIFTDIFVNNRWRDDESISGPGSNLLATNFIVTQLSSVFEKYKIKSILDAPCGDFNWMKKIDLSKISYTGIDIVEEIIEANNSKFKSDNITFCTGNISKVNLPKVDLILCRDCLVHLSYTSILEVIKNFKKSDSIYLMTTTFTDCKTNKDIVNGSWRKLNFNLPPFNFPEAIFILNENCPPEVDGGESYDKSLAIWKLSEI